MKRALAVIACAGVAACTPPAPEPTPPPVTAPSPAPTPTPAPPPPPPPQPVYDNLLDAPLTPGDWTYRTDSSGTIALFGQPRGEPDFALRCNPASRTVSLLRAGTGMGEVALRIRTEALDRVLTARQLGDQLPTLRTDLPATDPLLAAMAFSKGRFAVEAEGQRTLYIPAWPEITRVVEDCL